MKLILVSSGETILNIQNKVEGWSDSPLTDSGMQHAYRLKTMLENVEINKAFCSSSERAIDTAEIIIQDCKIPLIVNRGLKDINYGLMEASPLFILKEYNTNYPDHHGYSQVQGESKSEFEFRVKSYFEKIINCCTQMDQILIVTHKNVIKMFLDSIGLY